MVKKLIVGTGLVDYSVEEQAAYDANIAGLLESKKAKKKRQINIERDTRLAELTVSLDGIPYEATAESRNNITSTVAAINAGVIPVPDPISWRDANNVTQSLSHLKLLELAGLVFAAVDNIYQTSWAVKAQIDAATDIPSVQAITWPV